jgi:hypothetical protein
MNIREKINQFTSFTLEGDRKDGDVRKLIEALDELPFLVYASDFEFDGTDYPDAPTRDYQTIRSAIERKFPELGYYKTADYDDNLECTGNILIGDAIDDITDIVGDLLEVEWYFANTSEADALWHLETSYRGHWGNHLREVQLYLYRQHY